MSLGLAQAPQHYNAETMSVGSNTPDIKVLTGEDEPNPWGEDGFTFGDVLDMINPLQQIPGISTVYRAITGDEIAPAARLLGGSLLGGIPGLAMAAVNTVVEEATGSDIGSSILAAFTGGDAEEDVPAATAVASNAPSPEQNAAPPAVQVASAESAAAPSAVLPGATSGSESGTAAQQPLHFFTPASGQRVIYSRPQPGALANNLFQPLINPPGPAVANVTAPSSTPAPPADAIPAAAAQPTPKTAVTASQATPAAAQGASAPSSAEVRSAANRAAMLAFARDMKALAESHAGYNANEQLQKLAAAHAKSTTGQ